MRIGVIGCLVITRTPNFFTRYCDGFSIRRNRVQLYTVIAIFSGGWLSEALNGSDLTRKLKLPENSASSSFFARNKRTIFCFGLGFVGTGLLLTLAGLISAYLTKSDNPIGMLQIAFADNATILIISCIIIVFAQWTVNTCANIFPQHNYA
ncbi:hypothetical protein J4731_02860 [Providencia rettgeri]|nr:hypothetical protein [Providencia rettgeri]